MIGINPHRLSRRAPDLMSRATVGRDRPSISAAWVCVTWGGRGWLSAATCARDADGQQCAWGSAVRFDIGDDQITPEADDEMLSALAMKLAGEAGENEIVVGLDDYLSKLRDEARANAEE